MTPLCLSDSDSGCAFDHDEGPVGIVYLPPDASNLYKTTTATKAMMRSLYDLCILLARGRSSCLSRFVVRVPVFQTQIDKSQSHVSNCLVGDRNCPLDRWIKTFRHYCDHQLLPTDSSMAKGTIKRQGSAAAFSSFRVSKSTPASNIKKHTKNDSKSVKVEKVLASTDIEPPSVDHTTSSLSSDSKTEEEEIVRPVLDENDPMFQALAKQISALRKTPQIHTTTSTINTILRDFDLTGRYGPCVGITRLDRFKRAEKMNLKPPPEVGLILETQQAFERDEYKHELFYGRL